MHTPGLFGVILFVFLQQDIFVLLDLIGTTDVQFHNFFPQTSNAFELLARKGKL